MSAIAPLNVALMQAATHWHDAAANQQMFAAALEHVPDDVSLVVLPEMFSTGFTMASATVAESMQGPTVAWLQAQAQARGQVLCGSVVIESDGAFYNRFLAAEPNGALQIYDKRHLFRMAGEHEHYASGQARSIFDVAGWRVLPLVCYDLRFPVWSRNRQDYDLAVVVANWPAARQEAWQTLLRARAIENQCYVVGVNIVGQDGNGVQYGGGSAAYGPDGAVLLELGNTAQVSVVSLDNQLLVQHRETFPAWRDADDFQL